METASILGDVKIASILEQARTVDSNGVVGDFAEVGVYRGGVLRELAQAFPHRTVYGYDTFEGMPVEHWQEGEVVVPGQFDGTSLAEVQGVVADCFNVGLRKGVFPSTGVRTVYAFVHLDVDFYLATKAALVWLLPRMAEGGVIVLDDWDWEHCPGVRRAVEELGLVAQPTVVFQAMLSF